MSGVTIAEANASSALQYQCLVCGENSFAHEYCYDCCPPLCECGGGRSTDCQARKKWLETAQPVQMYQPDAVLLSMRNFLKQKSLCLATLDSISTHHRSFGDCAISFLLDLPKMQSASVYFKERMKSLSSTAGALIFTGAAILGTLGGGYQRFEKFLDLSGAQQKTLMASIDPLCTVQLACILVDRLDARRWHLREGEQICFVDNGSGLVHLPSDVDFRKIWFKKC
jgi:hypothetical protein